MNEPEKRKIRQAAEAILTADALLVPAGAGMASSNIGPCSSYSSRIRS